MIIRELLTKMAVKADTNKVNRFSGAVDKSKRKMKGASAGASVLKTKLSGLAASMGAFIGAAAGLKILKFFTTDFAKSADVTLKFSRGLTLNVEAYQKLRYAAGLAGLTTEEFNKSIEKSSEYLGRAADGGKMQLRTLGLMGITTKNLKTGIEGYIQTVQGLNKIKDPFIRAKVAKELFGRASTKALLLSKQSTESIRKDMAKAGRLGLALSEKQLESAAKFNDSYSTFKQGILGVRNAIAAKLLPSITKTINKIVNWMEKSGAAKTTLAGLTKAFRYVSNIFNNLFTSDNIEFIKKVLIDWVAVMKPIILSFVKDIKSLIKAGVAQGKALFKLFKKLWPILKITLMVGLLPFIIGLKVLFKVMYVVRVAITAVIDILTVLVDTLMSVGKAIFYAFGGKYIIKAVKVVIGAVKGVVKWFKWLFKEASYWGRQIKLAIIGYFLILKYGLIGIVRGIGKIFAGIFSLKWIRVAWNKFYGFIKDKIDWLLKFLPDKVRKALGLVAMPDLDKKKKKKKKKRPKIRRNRPGSRYNDILDPGRRPGQGLQSSFYKNTRSDMLASKTNTINGLSIKVYGVENAEDFEEKVIPLLKKHWDGKINEEVGARTA